jgi:hypothetical protein
MHPLRVERNGQEVAWQGSYAARDPATEGRARRSVVVVRFAFMGQRVAKDRARHQ